MRILVVDDEDLARERILRILDGFEEHEVVGEASNGHEALEKIDIHMPDLVLLDIRMPGMDGLEVARHLVDLDDPPGVIFTTAYDEYAIEAFKVHAVDYLLKPIRADRLKEALEKVMRPNKKQWRALNKKEDGSIKARTHISSRTRRGIVLVPVPNIYYFRAEHKYVTVKHQDGEVLIEDTLKELESEFPDKFLRIHRNCLVAMDYIVALEKNISGQPCIRLRGVEETLDVSRRHVAKVRQVMNDLMTRK